MTTPGLTLTPRRDAGVCLGLIAAVVVPAAITLAVINEPRPLMPIPATGVLTPYGYTVSLVLFLVPILVLGTWFARNPEYPIQRRVFLVTLLILVPLGFALDFLFAEVFFTFLNPASTLGIEIPVIGGAVPVEEFVFYLTGFLVTLLLYIWCDEYWCGAYNVRDHEGAAESLGLERVVHFHPGPLALGALLLAPAFAYEEFLSGDPDGFPGYYLFLVVGAILPSSVLYRAVVQFVNWRAFSLTFFLMLTVSLLWEATLARPYQWWGYHESQMMGIFIAGWADLPLEATLVWLAVSYTTVLVYETVSVVTFLKRPLRESLFGPASGPARRGG